MNAKEHQNRREILRKVIERIQEDPALKAYYLGMEAGEILRLGTISERGWIMDAGGDQEALKRNLDEARDVGVKIPWGFGDTPPRFPSS